MWRVQAAAIHQRLHGVRKFVGQAPVLTQRHFSIANILGGVVDRVRVLSKRAARR